MKDPINPGRKNIYICDTCAGHIVTADRDAGVTPFMIGCQVTTGCSGRMQSSMYRVFDPNDAMAPTHEWYKPGAAEIIKPHLVHHVSQGGLLLRSRARDHVSARIVTHNKTGGAYRVIGEGKMQAENWYDLADDRKTFSVDMTPVVIYQGEDGQFWVRPKEEFEDGRFTDG